MALPQLKKCPICETNYLHKSHSTDTKTCSAECHYKKLLADSLIAYEGKIEHEDYKECKICGHKGSNIQSHLQYAHKVKPKDYKAQYGDDSIIANCVKKKFSDGVKGEKNPGFNHGGKLSPFSNKFVGYEGLSESTKTKKIDGLKRVAVESKRNNQK